MSDKFEHNDPFEVILRTAGGVFFAVCDAVDAETSARAIKAMRAYADNNDCPDTGALCRGVADAQEFDRS
jgi:hypothetical protein